jgi:hypothetical protein
MRLRTYLQHTRNRKSVPATYVRCHAGSAAIWPDDDQQAGLYVTLLQGYRLQQYIIRLLTLHVV